MLIASHHVLQSWEMVDPGGKRLPMCVQEHSDTSTQRFPSKTFPAETHVHVMLLLATLQQREELYLVSEHLLGHVQPSTHSSLQTSCMLRLWQVVEQDLVHSLYCIPIGHFGTAKEIPIFTLQCFLFLFFLRLNRLTALALLHPALKKYPMSMACASILQQKRTGAFFCIFLVTMAGLCLTQRQKRIGRDQVGAVEEHTGGLQHAAAGQNLHKKTHACKMTFNI